MKFWLAFILSLLVSSAVWAAAGEASSKAAAKGKNARIHMGDISRLCHHRA